MLAEPDQHPLDAFVPDPSEEPALCDEAEFAEILEELVADSAPRVFAVVQEWGDRVDARIAAWGMSFDDHVDVVGGASVHLGSKSAEWVVRRFNLGTRVTARLVWVNPDAATPHAAIPDDEDDGESGPAGSAM